MIRRAAVWFPAFAIDRVLRSVADGARAPLALTERSGGRDVVVARSRAAAAAGVRVGKTVASARARCAALIVKPRDPVGDRSALEAAAIALSRFTPDVALDGVDGLLLETGRTAARFGGEAALLAAIRDLCKRAGFETALGVADGAGAARVLSIAAASTREGILRSEGPPARALAPLPIATLRPDAEAAAACEAFGLRTIGAVLQLPRAALSARFGAAFGAALAAALGEREDPLPRFDPPSGFSERLDFPAPTDAIGPVLFAATRLFDAAEGALEARDEGATEARAILRLSGGERHVAVLRPSAPTREARIFTRLLHHRLEGAPFTAPVEGLVVEIPASGRVPLRAAQGVFFPDRSAAERRDADSLRDRLATRLGASRVLAPLLAADHRPERAFRLAPNGADATPSGAAPPSGPRPLELCSPPSRIDVTVDARGAPSAWRVGPKVESLRVVRGPERVSAGWWDGADADRAYFEVETREGLRLWLFRDLVDGVFFRHGAFL